MTKPWVPSRANMASMSQDAEQIKARHLEHLAYYNATEADCEISNVEDAKSWERGLKSHYTLTLHTYLGWKVYMLHTGAFGWLSEYEQATDQSRRALQIAGSDTEDPS